MGIRIGPNPAAQGIRPERDDRPDEAERAGRADDAGAVGEANGAERPADNAPAAQGAAPGGEAAVVAISDQARELAAEAGATGAVASEPAPAPAEAAANAPAADNPPPPPPDDDDQPGVDLSA